MSTSTYKSSARVTAVNGLAVDVLNTPTQVDRTWADALKEAVRDPHELCRLVGLPAHYATGAVRAARDFSLFAPRGYIARMRPGDAHDPLLRQVLPLEDECAVSAGAGTPSPGTSASSQDPAAFSQDPVGDRAATRSAGLLHKYRSRVLMVTTGACAVHCRYCFRRHFPYTSGPHTPADWAPALAEIAADSSLREVIFSGGDPLTLVDAHLAELAERLASIGHLRRLRVHTRLPIMIPERVTPQLISWLRGTRLTPVFVIHANHAQELDARVAEALAELSDAGIPLLNQAVLLRGVNDTVQALVDLCERLVDLRVIPYYLHQLDRVTGAAHFEVPEAEGRRLVKALRRRISGYAVPRYVREIAGRKSKTPLA